MSGRIDVHSHLLPGVDDGCETIDESIACARMLVAAGYTHSFCTPHVLNGLVNQTTAAVADWTSALQAKLSEAGVPLTLLPGGEINIWPTIIESLPDKCLSTYGGLGKYCLVDLWADKLPPFFDPAVKWLQAKGPKVILAHPERMKAVQVDPGVADHFARLGLLLQGNLQCLSDPPDSATRVLAEKFLTEGRYFLLGSDLHRLHTLAPRLAGLQFAIELMGKKEIDRLTIEHPRLLLS